VSINRIINLSFYRAIFFREYINNQLSTMYIRPVKRILRSVSRYHFILSSFAFVSGHWALGIIIWMSFYFQTVLNQEVHLNP